MYIRNGIDRLKEVYGILMLGVLTMLLPIMFGMSVSGTALIVGIIIAKFALVIAICFTDSRPLSTTMFLAFTFLCGLMLSPLIITGKIPADVVIMSLGTTLALFTILTCCVVFTNKDFSSIGGFLMIALLLLIVMMIINIFVQSSIMTLLLAYVSVVIFSGFILYDTQNIMDGYERTPALGALSLFLDILNIFKSLVIIFMFDD